MFPAFNHLWQSSCFAIVAGLVALALRRNSPRVRYWVWLSASLKFLLPFALLVSVGQVAPRPASDPAAVAFPHFPNTVVQMAEPLGPSVRSAAPAHASIPWVSIAVWFVWAVGFVAIVVSRGRGWLRVRALLRGAVPIELPIPVRAVISRGAGEPAWLASGGRFWFCLRG